MDGVKPEAELPNSRFPLQITTRSSFSLTLQASMRLCGHRLLSKLMKLIRELAGLGCLVLVVLVEITRRVNRPWVLGRNICDVLTPAFPLLLFLGSLVKEIVLLVAVVASEQIVLLLSMGALYQLRQLCVRVMIPGLLDRGRPLSTPKSC
jgi:hypothetical protein